MGNIENGEITLAEYKRLNAELKASIKREMRLESALHDCCKLAESQDKKLKEAGL